MADFIPRMTPESSHIWAHRLPRLGGMGGFGPNMDHLPLRLEGRLAGALGISAGDLEICPQESEALPNLRCTLPRAVSERLSLVLRVHSLAGIPLASAPIQLNPGDRVL